MKFDTDIVIGLEVHVELNTKAKLFCSCSRKPAEDEQPNSRTCPVCLGHPGSKPVLNRKAVDYALKLALATGCSISPRLVFSRKSYFYPDMSKNYQISQYEIPLATGGAIKLSSGKEIKLTRIHMEEDPAALIHPAGMEKSTFVLVDYNRSGDPLAEVVTEPEMDGPGEARDFMKQLISILKYIGIFDADTCLIKADANVSIKESGYVRTEIKNISGFKEIERALRYEVERQKKEVAEGKNIIQETRAWDSDMGLTRSLRTKETEEDYGYIFDPDLVVTELTSSWVEKVKKTLPELAQEKAQRFVKQYGLKKDDAEIISAQFEMARLYEKVAEHVEPVLAAKWLRRELARVMNYSNIDFADLKIDETHLTELLSMVEKGEITDNVAQKLLESLVKNPFSVKEYVDRFNLKTVADEKILKKYCSQAIEQNKKVVEEFKSGNEKALNYLIGQVMRLTKGTASPKEVREILLKLIK